MRRPDRPARPTARRRPPLRLDTHPATAELLRAPSATDAAAHKHREDLVDAVLCAGTAAPWHRHGLDRCQVLGPTRAEHPAPAATIIAPARTEQRRPRQGAAPGLRGRG